MSKELDIIREHNRKQANYHLQILAAEIVVGLAFLYWWFS